MSVIPASHTHAFSNFAASSDAENSSLLSTLSEDIPSGTPLDSLDTLLRKRGIVDPSGLILHPEELPSFPTLDALDQEEVGRTLDKIVSVKAGDKEMKISLKEILLHVYSKCPALVPKVEIVGGFARKLLLSSPRFVSAALVVLTKLSPDEVKPYVDQIVTKAKQQQLPDIDLRVLSSVNQRSTLGSFTQSLVDYFSYKLQCAPYEARQNAFTKFHLIYDEKNQFSIATVKPQDSFEFELIFVGSLCRSHLFTHDSIRLSILPFLLGKGPVEIESDYGQPWQPIVDLLTKTIHVFQPESVDLFGFPRLMSFFSMGHKPSKPTDVIQLSSKVTQLSQYHVGVPQQVAGLLKTTWKNHHQRDPIAALILTLNACLHLNISAQDHKKIWKLMREEHWKALDLSHTPLLSMIDQAVIEHQIPLYVLSAALSIFWSGEDGKISIEGTESFLFTFLKPTEAVEQLSAHLLECPKLEGLSPLILNRNSTMPTPMTADILEKGIALLESKARSQRFLGYTLIAVFGNEENAPLLLEHFLDILDFFPAAQRPVFLEKIKKNPAFLSQAIAEFLKAHLSETKASKQMVNWIKTLASNPDHAQIASCLWMKYRLKYPEKIREPLDDKVIKGLLPEHWEEAVKVYEASLEASQPRLNTLAKLIPYVNRLPEAQFQTTAPKMSDLLSSTLRLESSVEASSTFTGPFANFFVRLLNSGNRDQAYELLELAAAHPQLKGSDPHLYRCRLVFMEQDDLPSIHMHSEWKKLKAMGAAPVDQTALYLKVHLKAIKQLTEDDEFINQGFQLLRIHSEASPSDPALRPLILKDITRLAACRAESSAAKLIDTVYRTHLTPEILASHRFFLFKSFFSRGEIGKAYKLWKTIKESYPETTRMLLDKLTRNKKPKKNLNAALRLLRNEISDELLLPDDKFDYFLKIQSFTRSTKLLANVTNDCFDKKLNLTNQRRLTERLVPALKSCSEKDQELLQVARSRTADILEILKDEKDDQQIESFIGSLEKHGIPLNDLPFCRLRTEYYVSRRKHIPAMAWMKRANAHDQEFYSWLREMLIAYQEMQPEEEAEALLAFRDIIPSLPQPDPLTERAAVIAAAPRVSPETSVALLRKFPPAAITAWEQLIETCPGKNFHLAWKSFYAWLGEVPLTTSEARRVVFKAFNRFHELSDSVEPELFETLSNPESPLGKLSKSAAEWMEMKGKLTVSYAKSAKDVEAIAAFFDPLENEIKEESFSSYRDLTLELAAVCVQKKEILFTNYACKIFSQYLTLFTKVNSPIYSEQITETLILLLKTLNNVPKGSSEDQISLLVDSSSIIRKKFPDRLPAVKIVNAMSSLNSPFVIDECVALLECSDVCPAYNEAWDLLLPALMESTLSKKEPESEAEALEQHETHQHKLTKGSEGFYRCSDLVLDIGIRNLDSRDTLLEFSKLIPSHLEKIVGQQDAFSVVFEMPLSPFFSPVFHLQPQTSEEAKKIFHNRMTALLSKVLETGIRCDQIEGFAHHFMTKNLTALCDYFPEKKEELIPLLDKYYYRYLPSISLFYCAHVGFAMKLLKHALSKGIYAHPHVKEIYEANLFLENKLIDSSGISKERKAQIIERIIDRYIAAQTPYPVVKAIEILQLTQHGVFHSNLKTVERIYTKLMDAAMREPFFTYKQFTQFEWIRRGIMQEGFPVVGYSSSEAGKTTASNLCEMLFHQVLHLSMTPAAFEKQSTVTEIHLLDWISKVLILSRQHLGFTDLKGPERYYQLVAELLPRITGIFDQMDDTQKERIASQMTRAIIGENFRRSLRLSKSCQRIRSALMRQWLLGIAHNPKFCAEQFKMAKHHQVFDKTPKDAAKVASMLK